MSESWYPKKGWENFVSESWYCTQQTGRVFDVGIMVLKKRVAFVPGFCYPGTYDSYPTQHTLGILFDDTYGMRCGAIS